MTHPQRILSYLRRRSDHQAPARTIGKALGLSTATVSSVCRRLQWREAVEYFPLVRRGQGVGVWRLKEDPRGSLER